MKTIKFLSAAVVLMLATSTFAQEFKVNSSKSNIKWEGKKIGSAHDGDIKLKEGVFTIKNNRISEGTFVIDMNTITNRDIESEEYRGKLIVHLKSDDFFGVEKHPTATLNITGSEKFKNDISKVKGDLKIKGKTHPVEFEVKRKGNTYTTTLVIDRTKFDIRYGSKSFFNDLGDRVIHDDFTLDISLVVN